MGRLVRFLTDPEISARLLRDGDPYDETLVDVARRQLAFDGIRRRVLDVKLPGAYGRGLASGALRGGPDALQGAITFDEWLRSPDHTRG